MSKVLFNKSKIFLIFLTQRVYMLSAWKKVIWLLDPIYPRTTFEGTLFSEVSYTTVRATC